MTGPGHRVLVDGRGLLLRDPQLLVTMDVLFDGHRVWSLDPQRDGRIINGERLVAWPGPMRRFLNGSARVQLREHSGDNCHFDGEVDFGHGSGRVRFADHEGNALALSKSGIFVRDFSMRTDDARRELIVQVSRVLSTLNEQHRVPAYLCYGLLLGAVREGQMLRHDDDGDIGYLSGADHPADVILESFELERVFQRNGWATQRMSGGTFKVFSQSPDGGRIGIDVFASFYLSDTFYLMGFVSGHFDRSKLLPFTTVTLEDQQLPAPAHPITLLELTYGPTWKIPDPAFKFQPPPATKRRLSGWMRGDRPHRRWWNDFYDRLPTSAALVPPTDFARWVSTQPLGEGLVLEVGSGQGQDAVWLSQQGHQVLGMDYASSVLAQAGRRATAVGTPAEFRHLNLCDLRETLVTAAQLVRAPVRPSAIYARWLLDSLNEDGRRNFLTFASMVLQGVGGRLYTEVRLVRRQRALPRQAFPGQWQAQLSVDQIRDEIAERGGTVECLERLDAMDDAGKHIPARCRLVARWTT